MLLAVNTSPVCVRPRQAKEILARHNGNKDLNSPEGLEKLMRRFVQFNGAVSADQLNWLDNVLRLSDDRNEVVLVASMSSVHQSVNQSVAYCFTDNLKVPRTVLPPGELKKT